MRSIADRKDELALFERILQGAETRRILLLEGPSERGKSILLAELAELAEEILGKGCCARADLKGGLSLNDLFAGFCTDLGTQVFATYSVQPAVVPVEVHLETNLAGAKFRDANTVTVQPIIHTPLSNSVHQGAHAILHDLRVCRKPLVLIIDTFEAATDEASRWVVQQFLPAIRHAGSLCIILGGQRVPDPKDFQLTWGQFAVRRTLHPVTSIEDWHEFACSRHPAFPRHHIETILMGGLVNRPSIIQGVIETIARQLPQDNPGAAFS
jgi:hypothetical protein